LPVRYDYSPYIGIPWESGGRDKTKSLDCWGIVWSIYNDLYKIPLPSLSDIHVANGVEETSLAISEVYPSIYKDFYVPDVAMEGDIIMLRVQGQPIHIGVCISRDKMIHTTIQTGCITERFTNRTWLSRIEGIYRHKGF
jgi:cell wall-associated NlpC family hydrolase